ncbi:tRNA-specific adenosine deaminase 1 isoform X2 [Adelges cooleyi]|uniref:tRNA-specific adenosine deaminase 1 isoform X2 n=1 Tax=Adelges cooleyi TaxID=133065 RepID=UPI00217FD5F8|nr:tRNA-specific adenosine deaminase 1 isoform X2 [Adelges cooleyi]
MLSQMPCGDASIFPKNEDCRKRSADTDIGSKVKKQKVDDIHRTGAKCLLEETKQDLNLPGPAYHTVGAVRTKPGRGDPTLSMSCSDKILRWNHIGVQGAMLSLLIDPVYLSTMVISGQCPYSHTALHRAVVGRLNTPGKTYPSLLRSSLNFQDSKHSNPLSKPCPSSVLWRIGDEFNNDGYHEVLVDGRKQGVTKKTMDKPSSASVVCKKSLFDTFKSFNEKYSSMTYQAVKSEATAYKQQWDEKTQQLGCWTEKSKSLIEFT